MKIKALTKYMAMQELTGKDFATLLSLKGIKIDSSQISRWERGERFPKLTTIVAVAKATGLKVEDLVPQGEN